MLKLLILADLNHPPHPSPPIPIMPTHQSCSTLLGGVGAYTQSPMNSSTTHPTMHPTTTHTTTHHPPHEHSNHPTTTHPMNPPKYMHSERVTLWICLMGGWMGVYKIKYFNIVTVHGWVSICTHHMKPPTTHPTTTHPMNPSTTHPTTNPPTHAPSNHPITTHLPPHELSKVYV